MDQLLSSDRAGSRKSEGGAVMPIFAMMIVILIGMAAFSIDYGWLFYNQLNAQKTAEAAALAGVVHMPLPNCVPPDSGTDPNTVAHDVASRNGYKDGIGAVGVSVAQGATCAQLSVTVTDSITPFFMQVFGVDSLAISRTATAEHLPNLKLGSDDPFLGEDPTMSGRDVDFFVAVNGDNTNKAQGDAFTSKYYGDYNTAHGSVNFEFNQSNPPDTIRPDGSASYYYAIDVPASHLGDLLTVQIYDAQANPGGNADDRDLNNPHSTWNPPADSRLRFRLLEPDDTPNVWTDNAALVSGCDKTYYHEDNSHYDPTGKDSWTLSGNSFCTDTAIQGIYVLEVTQTGDVDLVNGFSLRALIGGSPSNDVAVYGLGSMSLWMFEAGSAARFKAVRLDDVYAGSRLIVQLWDVGDIDGTGSIEFKGSLTGWDCQIRNRDDHGNVTSDWHGDDGPGCFENISPEREHNNEWIDFAFQLDGFSCVGDACWATVQYNLPGTPHDRTTWSAFIDGQPIHLVP